MKITPIHIFIGIATVFFACQGTSTSEEQDSALLEKATQIAQSTIITDGHVDLPYRMKVERFQLKKEFLDYSVRTDGGDFDYVRAKEGGLDAPFMSIYIPARYQEKEGASKIFADSLIGMVEGIAEKHPDKFALARTPADIETNFEKGLISLPMGMENGAPIEKDVANVAYFYDRGIRYITLTHSKVNNICDSSYDTTRTWNGLSPFGRDVVKEMNRVGIMVDISHVSDSTFYQVMELTQAPVIASHSSCRAFTPGFERNMSDEMIKRLGENKGVIQINFGSTFLDSTSIAIRRNVQAHIGEWLAEKGLDEKDPEAKTYIEAYMKENPMYSTVTVAADHIDHVVSLAGIDHVGFGSDFDGVGDSLPTGLKRRFPVSQPDQGAISTWIYPGRH